MSNYIYGFTALTGGTTGCLDNIDGSLLGNQDMAVGTVLSTGVSRVYALNATSGATADGVYIITPATNAGNKRWILQIPAQRYYSNNLTGDVTMTYSGQFYDGPSVGQPTGTGVWFASGEVSFEGNDHFIAKLWDGTTVFKSLNADYSAAGNRMTLAISGICINPTGNIRISVESINSGGNKIAYNVSGLGKDSTISVIRIG